MEGNIKVLTDFAGSHPGLFIFTMLILLVVVSLICFGLYKLIIFFVKKADFEVKAGDKRFKLKGKDDSETTDPAQEPIHFEKFYSTLSTIIQYSIDTGYENSKKRQELFDSQMNKIKANSDVIQTFIIEGYISKGGANVEIARALLYYCFSEKVIAPFRKICIADRLAEKTKEEIVNNNRNFIDTAYHNLWIELQNLLNYSNENSSLSSNILIDCLKEQKDYFKKMLVSSLEYAYDEAVKCLKEVHNNNDVLDDKIKNVLKIHFDKTVNSEDLPESLIDEDLIMPPNNVAGV
jgi:hypothetical protein